MKEPAIGMFDALKRFALDKLDDGQDAKFVLLTLETIDTKGSVTRIEATMLPDEAIRIGKRLVEIGTALSSVRH